MPLIALVGVIGPPRSANGGSSLTTAKPSDGLARHRAFIGRVADLILTSVDIHECIRVSTYQNFDMRQRAMRYRLLKTSAKDRSGTPQGRTEA